MVVITNDLQQAEYVPLFRAALDFNVLERVEQVFVQNANNVRT